MEGGMMTYFQKQIVMNTTSREAELLKDALDAYEAQALAREPADPELEAFTLEPYDVPELEPAPKRKPEPPIDQQQALDLD
jgi:hypothetical protein